MEYRDYYRILGVEKDASKEEIRRAYRQLARKYHPDVNPDNKDAEERFKEINEAHEVLRDSEKRNKYDRLGANWQRYQQMGGDPSGFDWGQWFSGEGAGPGGQRVHTEYVDLGDILGGSGFSDFFQYIFGGRAPGGSSSEGFGRSGRRRMVMRGRDVEQPVEISLEEAYHGTTRVFQVGQRRLEISIPPGVQTGSRVRVAGGGEAGAGGGQSGDLYLIVSVRKHPTFRREGADLRMTLPVDLYTLVLGAEAVVQTLTGPVSLKIPRETKAGQHFRLRGRGMPLLRHPSDHGDLYVEVQPIIPQKLSAEEEELFRQLAGLRE
jgi:curved DNA-binding protein